MTSWLHRQRKQAILDLSSEAGLKQNENDKKDDLIDALDAYLQQEKTRLSGNSSFDQYYGTRRTPAKPRASIAPSAEDASKEKDGNATVVKSVVKQGGARPTKVKQEGPREVAGPSSSPVQAFLKSASDTVNKVTETISKSTEAASSAVTKTTKTPVRRKSVLPPTPRDVANQVEEQSNRLYANIDSALSTSGIHESIDYVRDLCSSVSGVQLTFLAIEGYALGQEVLPWQYFTDVPLIPVLGLPDHVALKLPNFFALLTGHFWSTTLLWALTSVLVPTLFAYFYNLTIRDIKKSGTRVTVARYRLDPLSFNVVKALLTWLVYGRGVSFGFINPETALRVNQSLYGGYNGVLVGAYVCILASLYEAAQRK